MANQTRQFSRRVPLVQIGLHRQQRGQHWGLEIELQGQKGLYGFPANLTIEAKADGFKYSQVALIGRDIHFADSTGGTLLPYQFDGWNPEPIPSLGQDTRVKPSSEETPSKCGETANAVTEFPAREQR